MKKFKTEKKTEKVKTIDSPEISEKFEKIDTKPNKLDKITNERYSSKKKNIVDEEITLDKINNFTLEKSKGSPAFELTPVKKQPIDDLVDQMEATDNENLDEQFIPTGTNFEKERDDSE
eukprot:CAMPEP_0116956442 /NCGR_PEP_ID=MMETSP0467-20121206/43330_1 /TAXON_ID=283647 /ORGANISM="Mesodinium pulex, Strain SPMC105" /LENGTH=118 /DNA_ID=CAMNT_0004642905 /DNA_START=486 /DNA_END=842 /DNA_ORIENTATION=-